MTEQKFINSERGTEAAWKGFSSQTTYIAYRIMFMSDDGEFCPEKVEDLLIEKNGLPIELVQVKNLTDALSLSDLDPKKEDSFFRRCLDCKKQNPNLVLRVVSFGPIGQELQGAIRNQENSKNSIISKLSEYGYSERDIRWLWDHLIVDQVDEDEMSSKICKKLESTVESMAAPQVAFDILCRYVSQLSRSKGRTSNAVWQKKLQEIGLALASLSGLANQYGKTILPLYEYGGDVSYDVLRKGYLEGVNASPQHIRVGLDVERSYWLNRIGEAFDNHNIVIIRGASGQGKSSMAYRFLMNNYDEIDVLCIETITNKEQVKDIRSALSGIAQYRTSIIAYIDVEPYDTNWLWLCEKLSGQSINIKLLVTIREEDYRRTVVDRSKLSFEEIELVFSKEEASELFQSYFEHDFLSFDNAWRSFGEIGPLMEFTYMLNQSKTMRDRISSQIDRITQNESDADEWLRVLTVICYAGKENIRVDIAKLFSAIACSHQRRMLDTFEKEFFLRTVSNGRYIEPLHVLRARIIYDILRDEALFPELQVLTTALNSTDENALMLVVSYIYENGIDSKVVDELAIIKYESWTLYASVLKSLLWAEVYTYHKKNKNIIAGGDLFSCDAFSLLFLVDITGYYSRPGLSDLLEEDRPGIKKKIDSVLDKLNPRIIGYHYVDKFMLSTIEHLPLSQIHKEQELTHAGYSLFWLGKRGYFISEEQCPLILFESKSADWLEGYLNFLVGVQEQQWRLVYTSLYDFVRKQLQKKYNLILYDDSGAELFAVSIMDIFDEKGKHHFNADDVVSIVESVRRLCSSKEKYNVEIIGADILEGIVTSEMQRHIPADNLPWVWITQLNEWHNNLHDYDLFPANWGICLQNIRSVRNNITRIAEETVAGIDYLYKKREYKKLFNSDHIELIVETLKCLENTHAFSPQSDVDKYGIHSNNVIVHDLTSSFDIQRRDVEQRKDLTDFKKHFNRYCSSFGHFLRQRNEAIKNKTQEIEISNIGERALICLIEALEELSIIQIAYENEFALKNPDFDHTEEYQQMLLLGGVWSYFCKHPSRAEQSVAYDRKLYIKNYCKKIDKFLQLVIPSYEGVMSSKQNQSAIELIVDAEHVDTICSQMFEDAKREFSEISRFDVERIIWKDRFDKVIIKMNFLGGGLPWGYSILSKHFIVCDCSEQFLRFRFPIDDTVELETCKNALVKCFAYFQPLQILAQHVEQVNGFILEQDKTLIADQVVQIWEGRVRSLINEWLENVENNMSYIFENLCEGTEKMKPEFQKILLQIQEFREYLETNIFTIGSSDVASISNEFCIRLSVFADQLPLELFKEDGI